ncbi:glycosyl transferase [Nonlabens ulvanivorans]|uniref:Glycosyl transferase n=1 Tax=Nonlabens ulvanivorans TaxID=906888 RepID=A0A081DD44_NONUL|nr:TIGR04283 family arsenosugar biosynthesis glycosyltransferase [Nonlabens ulvanivorans]GAK76840.1 glycosyl transferase [Nonlabens ulvanivorans]
MISIIIPVLNEEHSIYQLLTHLVEKSSNINTIEIIVIDGHSIDNTDGQVSAFAKAYPSLSLQFHTASKGRGSQMHAGSQIANGEILYFLHADSFPPQDYDKYIIQAVSQGNPAGCFRMRFMSWNWWLIIIGWFTRFSWRASRGGDQSQYITKELYEKIGGYNTEIPIYEDYDLIHRLYDHGAYYVIPKWLKTSARRYEEIGVYKLQWFYITIYWKKRNGATIDEIYEYYLKWCQTSQLQKSSSQN